MVCVRSVVGIAKGTVAGVPAGNGTGNVIFESDVYVAGLYVTPVPPEPTRLIPGTVPTVLSTVMKFRRAPEYVTPYPARSTVFSLPNHGTFHASPTAGPKLFESSPSKFGEISGLGEFFPTNCT